MQQLTLSLGHKIVNEAQKWLGYLEHNDNKFLGMYKLNYGKGGYTVFGELARTLGKRNLQGLPWCATFIWVICAKALGVKETKKIMGRPHASCKNLVKAFKKRKRWKDNNYVPSIGDVVFFINEKKKIFHCGFVIEVSNDEIICIDGNTVDPEGHFMPEDGGAVAERRRKLNDNRIYGYGIIGGDL